MVSVIIPVYNRPLLLRKAAESVLNQSFRDFELIIVDDGSEDETPAAAQTMAREAAESGHAPAVRVLTIPRCGKPGAVRNRGAEAARGDLLAFLDSDDLWLPDKLKLQTAFMENNPDLRLSHTREQWLRKGKIVSQKGQKHRREGFIFDDALIKCIIGPSTVMLRRQLFEESGGFDESLEVAEDYEYWLRITASEPVGYLNEALTIKQAGEWEQLSEKYGQIEIFRIRALERFLAAVTQAAASRDEASRDEASRSEEPEMEGSMRDKRPGTPLPAGLQARARQELIRKCRIYAAGCLKRGRQEEAEVYEKRAAALLSGNNKIGSS